MYVGATWVHFKSKKSLYRRKQMGKQEANATMSQKQQRRHNVRKKWNGFYMCNMNFILQKAHTRLRVLNQS